jgi:hypothetical protein
MAPNPATFFAFLRDRSRAQSSHLAELALSDASLIKFFEENGDL